MGDLIDPDERDSAWPLKRIFFVEDWNLSAPSTILSTDGTHRSATNATPDRQND